MGKGKEGRKQGGREERREGGRVRTNVDGVLEVFSGDDLDPGRGGGGEEEHLGGRRK
jgi:hypothetical protein